MNSRRIKTWAWVHKWSSLVCTVFMLLLVHHGAAADLPPRDRASAGHRGRGAEDAGRHAAREPGPRDRGGARAASAARGAVRLAAGGRRRPVVRHAHADTGADRRLQVGRRRCAHGSGAGAAQVRRGLHVRDVQAARRPVRRPARQAVPRFHGPAAAGGDRFRRGAVFALHAQARLRHRAARAPARASSGWTCTTCSASSRWCGPSRSAPPA